MKYIKNIFKQYDELTIAAGLLVVMVLVLLGVSIAVKQLAILVVPVFLLVMWWHKNMRPAKLS